METVYVTTNIRLKRTALKRLKFSAIERNESVSALMREIINKHIMRNSNESGHVCFYKNIWDLPKKSVKTGDKKLASRVDEIVYGE